MEIQPMSAHVGVELTGAQLAALDAAGLAEIKRLVARHGLLVARGQELSPAQHVELGRRWGGIDVNNYFPLNAEFPEIAEIRKADTQLTNISGG